MEGSGNQAPGGGNYYQEYIIYPWTVESMNRGGLNKPFIKEMATAYDDIN
jgi:hypothetical protein